MSETHGDQHVTADPAHAAHHGEAAFSDRQLSEFHKADAYMGGAVVVLMTAIFIIGLLLYTTILIVVY